MPSPCTWAGLRLRRPVRKRPWQEPGAVHTRQFGPRPQGSGQAGCRGRQRAQAGRGAGRAVLPRPWVGPAAGRYWQSGRALGSLAVCGSHGPVARLHLPRPRCSCKGSSSVHRNQRCSCPWQRCGLGAARPPCSGCRDGARRRGAAAAPRVPPLRALRVVLAGALGTEASRRLPGQRGPVLWSCGQAGVWAAGVPKSCGRVKGGHLAGGVQGGGRSGGEALQPFTACAHSGACACSCTRVFARAHVLWPAAMTGFGCLGPGALSPPLPARRP